MGRLIDRMAPGRSLLWLDSIDYATQLLAGGVAPWNDVAAALAWMRKAQGLLRSDVVGVPLAAVIAAQLQKRGELLAAMSAKQRVLAPIKVLLADESLRGHLLELVRGLRAGFDDVPLVLCVPSPKLWPALAYAQAFGGTKVEIGDDDADGAAVYIADFLRSFGEAGVDAVLLEESVASAPKSADDLELYQPVVNVARHYRWNIALMTPTDAAIEASSSFDLLIAPGATLPLLGESFWNSGAAPAGALRYARVPPGLQPEVVLERIAGLR